MIGDHYGQFKNSVEGKRTARQSDVVRGWWENLGPAPIWIEDKYHLKKVCQEIEKKTGRSLIPRMFAKPKSQGKGLEWNFETRNTKEGAMATKKKEEGGLTVRMSKVKELVVELTDLTREPKFTFNGDWQGKDVRIVLRHISQAYRRNQIAKAKAMASEQEETPQTTGATHDS